MRGGIYKQARAARVIGTVCRQRRALQEAVNGGGGAPAIIGRADGRIGRAVRSMTPAAENFWIAGDTAGGIDFDLAFWR